MFANQGYGQLARTRSQEKKKAQNQLNPEPAKPNRNSRSQQIPQGETRMIDTSGPRNDSIDTQELKDIGECQELEEEKQEVEDELYEDDDNRVPHRLPWNHNAIYRYYGGERVKNLLPAAGTFEEKFQKRVVELTRRRVDVINSNLKLKDEPQFLTS